MTLKTEKIEFQAQYSGAQSAEFWAKIRAIKPKAAREEAYSLGCVLQSTEAAFIGQLTRLARKKP